ncbi:hypothetical protein CEXT_40951 [Caerostris extrusa]|uniref:Mos1 transposase HTH domain-containing protein n=1 Tax=Caerostris extrusa TaxID=172846 RepID=A0AAV4XT37_CAEEX|nr:hypothetical protein CEXT_40951 [Caerostris extrusa]
MRFLNARRLEMAEIHLPINEDYGENVLNDRKVRKWCRAFNPRVHDEEQSGRLSVMDEDLVQWYMKLIKKFEATDAIRFHHLIMILLGV